MPHGRMPEPTGVARNMKGTILRLLKYMVLDHWFVFLVVVVGIIVSAQANVQGSLFLTTLIDDYIAPLKGVDNPDYSGLLRACLVMAAIYAVGVVATYLYNRIMAVMSQGILRDIRDEMFTKMQKLPIRYFDSNTTGDIMSRFTNDTDTMRQMISMSMPQLISSIISVISVLVAMIKLSWMLTVVVIVVVFVIMLVSGKIVGFTRGYFRKQQRALGKLNGFVEEMTNGQRVVKVFNHEEIAEAEFDELNAEWCDAATKANFVGGTMMPLNGFLGNVVYVVIAVAGGAIAIGNVGGGLTLGAIAGFLQLTRSFIQPVTMISQQFTSVVMAVAGAERVFALMDAEPEEDNGTVTLVSAIRKENGDLTETGRHTDLWAWKVKGEDGRYTYVELKGDVRLEHVVFSYDGEKTVLHDISLFAKPGEKIAFVGATGAGKTTITNLINRFYDIQEGTITYDGIDIRDIKKDDLRHSLGMVLQDVNLFTGTVRENIRYGKLDASDEEIVEAAKKANAHGFITMLPNGYDTELSGDGAGLSQGQRQLLSIARAAAEDPPVMILDEATSSIDTRTELIVQRGMDELMEGRTVFVIAHRLSTVQNSQAIMVLENGSIIERGDHEELVALGGRYYQLYTGGLELE